MAEPDNVVLAQLRGVRQELAKLARDHEILLDRFRSIQLSVQGESFMGRVTAGDIEEQLTAVRARLDALESR
jgi:archaellum component FlaC